MCYGSTSVVSQIEQFQCCVPKPASQYGWLGDVCFFRVSQSQMCWSYFQERTSSFAKIVVVYGCIVASSIVCCLTCIFFLWGINPQAFVHAVSITTTSSTLFVATGLGHDFLGWGSGRFLFSCFVKREFGGQRLNLKCMYVACRLPLKLVWLGILQLVRKISGNLQDTVGSCGTSCGPPHWILVWHCDSVLIAASWCGRRCGYFLIPSNPSHSQRSSVVTHNISRR